MVICVYVQSSYAWSNVIYITIVRSIYQHSNTVMVSGGKNKSNTFYADIGATGAKEETFYNVYACVNKW